MDFYALDFRYSLGYAKIGGVIIILLASMAWESYFEYLEFDSRLLDVDYLVGTKSPFLWGHWEDVGIVRRFDASVVFLNALVVGVLRIVPLFLSLYFLLD